MSDPHILIEGIGGIGGVIAAGLLNAGYNITLITSNQQITNSINEHGIRLINGSTLDTYPTSALTNLDELPTSAKFDMAFLIMKANQVEEATSQTLPYLASDGFLATFQNGIVEELVMDIAGPSRIIPVTVGFGGTMHRPGIYEKTSPGGFHIGEWSGTITRRLGQLKQILESIDEVTITRNIKGVLWSKLAINSTINTLGAITGLTLGELLSEKDARTLFLELYREVIDVAEAKGITPEGVAFNPYLLYVPQDAGGLHSILKDIVVRVVGFRYRNLKSSTLQSIERGRKSEIDYLNGYVVHEADKLDVNVPANRTVTAIMRRIDMGELDYKPENLDLVQSKMETISL